MAAKGLGDLGHLSSDSSQTNDTPGLPGQFPEFFPIMAEQVGAGIIP